MFFSWEYTTWWYVCVWWKLVNASNPHSIVVTKKDLYMYISMDISWYIYKSFDIHIYIYIWWISLYIYIHMMNLSYIHIGTHGATWLVQPQHFEFRLRSRGLVSTAWFGGWYPGYGRLRWFSSLEWGFFMMPSEGTYYSPRTYIQTT